MNVPQREFFDVIEIDTKEDAQNSAMKGDNVIVEDVRTFGIILDAEYDDTENLLAVLGDLLQLRKRGDLKKILCHSAVHTFEKGHPKAVDTILAIITKQGKKYAEETLNNQGITCQIRKVTIKKVSKRGVHVCLVVECTYSALLDFVRKKISRSRNEKVSRLGSEVIDIIEQILPSDIADKFIEKLLNEKDDINAELRSLCEEMIKQKSNLSVTLSVVEVQIQKHIKPKLDCE